MENNTALAFLQAIIEHQFGMDNDSGPSVVRQARAFLKTQQIDKMPKDACLGVIDKNGITKFPKAFAEALGFKNFESTIGIVMQPNSDIELAKKGIGILILSDNQFLDSIGLTADK